MLDQGCQRYWPALDAAKTHLPHPAYARLAFNRDLHRTGSRQRLKLVLPDGMGIRDLYQIAAARQVQLRRLDYKKDSLEDIFLKAMEGGADGRV